MSSLLTGRRLRRATIATLAVASVSAVALAAAAPAPVDYVAAGGATMTSLRPTGVGLPQIGESGTVGAGDLAAALRTYHDSGAYDADLAAVGSAAQSYLDQRLAGTAPAPPASTPAAGGGGTTTSTPATPGPSTTKPKPTTKAAACTTRYVQIRRPKGRAKLYRRVRACPKAKAKPKAKKSSITPPAKPAIVLDIDETSLSNYSGLVASGFSSAGTVVPAAAGTGTAIAPTLALYRDAREHGVAVFFITGRPSAISTITADNLTSVGYTQGWDDLEFKPSDQGTEAFKAGARAAIEAKGYDIVLDLGDQESDLDGGHADRDFKLPNPFYFIGD